jgi:hypothetical protein
VSAVGSYSRVSWLTRPTVIPRSSFPGVAAPSWRLTSYDCMIRLGCDDGCGEVNAIPRRRARGRPCHPHNRNARGSVGSAVLVGIAALTGDRQVFYASVVYSSCLLTTLACSAAYHLVSNPSRRKSLRQLDHAAIFLLIAGTYIPFTTCRLHGVWAIGMTGAVWTGAVAGAVTKLLFPGRFERGSIVAYLSLAWVILVGMRPEPAPTHRAWPRKCAR